LLEASETKSKYKAWEIIKKKSGKNKEEEDPQALAQKTKNYNIKNAVGDQISCCE
jgi:hypothetical protein